jgi:hypothetical protein
MKAVQVVGKRAGRDIAPLWFFMQALQANGLEVGGKFSVQPRRGHRILGDHLKNGLGGGFGPKRRPAGQ